MTLPAAVVAGVHTSLLPPGTLIWIPGAPAPVEVAAAKPCACVQFRQNNTETTQPTSSTTQRDLPASAFTSVTPSHRLRALGSAGPDDLRASVHVSRGALAVATSEDVRADTTASRATVTPAEGRCGGNTVNEVYTPQVTCYTGYATPRTRHVVEAPEVTASAGGKVKKRRDKSLHTYVCTLSGCDGVVRRFRDNISLLRHKRAVHRTVLGLEPHRYPCWMPICSHSYKTRAHLHRHARERHGEGDIQLQDDGAPAPAPAML